MQFLTVELPQIQLQVFPVIIQYFYRKNGLQKKLVEVQQHSNEAIETVAHYIKGTLKNHVFFLICRISGFLTLCYFSDAFRIFMALKTQKISTF